MEGNQISSVIPAVPRLGTNLFVFYRLSWFANNLMKFINASFFCHFFHPIAVSGSEASSISYACTTIKFEVQIFKLQALKMQVWVRTWQSYFMNSSICAARWKFLNLWLPKWKIQEHDFHQLTILKLVAASLVWSNILYVVWLGLDLFGFTDVLDFTILNSWETDSKQRVNEESWWCLNASIVTFPSYPCSYSPQLRSVWC